MPKIFEIAGYKVFFWTNEYSGLELEPIHVHVDKTPSQNSPKLWVNRRGDCRWVYGENMFSPAEINKIETAIYDNIYLIIEKWESHFKEEAKFKDF